MIPTDNGIFASAEQVLVELRIKAAILIRHNVLAHGRVKKDFKLAPSPNRQMVGPSVATIILLNNVISHSHFRTGEKWSVMRVYTYSFADVRKYRNLVPDSRLVYVV